MHNAECTKTILITVYINNGRCIPMLLVQRFKMTLSMYLDVSNIRSSFYGKSICDMDNITCSICV